MEDVPEPDPSDASVTKIDRRRAGRIDVAPELLPILRNPAGEGSSLDGSGVVDAPTGRHRHRVVTLLGGALLSLLIWGAILGAYLFFRR